MDDCQADDPYVPMLADRPRHAVILAARGGVSQDPGGAMAHMNHLESQLTTALAFMGITQVHYIAIEGQEVGGEVLATSVQQALEKVDALVDELIIALKPLSSPQPA